MHSRSSTTRRVVIEGRAQKKASARKAKRTAKAAKAPAKRTAKAAKRASK